MPFLCPICKTATMQSASLEPDLPTEQCTTCLGHWITAARYFSFLSSAPASTPDPKPDAPKDPSTLKMCPTCLKFMRYYPVGHDLLFGIDKCNTCGGVWLNKGEWESLKAHALHAQLHAISSDTWQEDLHRRARLALEEAATERRLGPADYAELKRIAGWLRDHPHHAEIFAYLQKEGHPPVR